LLISFLKRNALNSVLLVTAAFIAAVSFFIVHGYHDPSGGDGYFYLKQAEWLAGHAAFYHADYSFVFIPLALLAKLTGSALLAFQIVSNFSYFIILFIVADLFKKYLPDSFSAVQKTLLAMLLMVALSIQTPVLRLGFEFIKNGFAIALFLTAFRLLLSKHIKTALVMALLAALTHKTVALMVFVGAVIYILQSPRIQKKFVALVAALAALLIGTNPRLSRHFIDLYNNLQFEKHNTLFESNSHLGWAHVVLIFLWFAVFISQYKKIKIFLDLNPYQKMLFSVLKVFILIPLFPFFDGLNLEIKWRLMIFSFVFAFLLFSQALSFIKTRKIVLASLMVSLSLMSYEYFHGSGFPWIIPFTALAPDVQKLNEFVKPGDELITHHGMQFYVDYKTPIRAKSLLTPKVSPQFQLAYLPDFFLQNPEASDDILQNKIVSVGPDYALFYYQDFQALMKQYPYLKHWRNSFKERPSFVQSYE
jgi:hypothetical protein